MRIRIVFLLGTLRMGGTERQFLETIRRLDRRRFEPRVLALPDSGPIRAEIEALGVPVTCLGMPPAQGAFRLSSLIGLGRMFRDMLRYLRREQPHILQSYQFWTNIYAAVAGKIAGTPVILTGRRESLDPKYRRAWKLALRDLSNRWATAILANSERVKAECLRAEPMTVEKLAEKLGADANETMTLLSIMEIGGLVRREAGNQFFIPVTSGE